MRLLNMLLELCFDVGIILDPLDLPVHQLKRLVLKSVGVLKACDEDGIRALCSICHGVLSPCCPMTMQGICPCSELRQCLRSLPADDDLGQKCRKAILRLQARIRKQPVSPGQRVAKILAIVRLVKALREGFEQAVIAFDVAPLEGVDENEQAARASARAQFRR